MKNKAVSLLFFAGLSLFIMMISCTTSPRPKEGFIEVEGGKIWYRIVGEGDKTPVVLLHGGPGSSSFYLESLKELSDDRPVIFIDQLGCGRSTRITDTTLMTIEKNVEQLEQVRKALKLERFYLYGHSWGTMLGLDYYLKYPTGIQALIFASPLFSTKIWTDDADTLISTLPKAIQLSIKESEKKNDFNNASYKQAMEVYYKAFVRRSDKSKSEIETMNKYFGTNVYTFMWGPSEFTATGNLLNYNRLSELATIQVPTLLTAGEFDEARPKSVRYYTSLIPGAQFQLIPRAAHSTMMDNPKENNRILMEFLNKMDLAN